MATTRLGSVKEAFRKYFPQGFAWEGEKFKQVVDAFAVEFWRAQGRFDDFLCRESDPKQTLELIEDWEKMLGIPDECTVPGTTIEERRAQICQKLVATGGSSFEYYEQIAAALGFEVTVSDYKPFVAGSLTGDKLTNDPIWTHRWLVTAPADTFTVFKAGREKCGDKLVEVGNETLQCTFEKLKPAHTEVLFSFTG